MWYWSCINKAGSAKTNVYHSPTAHQPTNVFYGCTHGRDRDCKNQYIREEELIAELVKLLDKISINELGMRHKLEDEIKRFNHFQKVVMKADSK